MISALMVSCATAQQPQTKEETKQQKKEQKEAKKKQEEAQQMALFNRAVAALKAQSFVLEADRIVLKRGQVVYVNDRTNFVSLDGDKASVQLAFNTARPLANGIGGVTVDGRASNVKIKEDKKGNVTFTMSVTGSAISAQIEIRIPYGGTNVQATVLPNFSSNRITFGGTIVPFENSEMFKGSTLP